MAGIGQASIFVAASLSYFYTPSHALQHQNNKIAQADLRSYSISESLRRCSSQIVEAQTPDDLFENEALLSMICSNYAIRESEEKKASRHQKQQRELQYQTSAIKFFLKTLNRSLPYLSRIHLIDSLIKQLQAALEHSLKKVPFGHFFLPNTQQQAADEQESKNILQIWQKNTAPTLANEGYTPIAIRAPSELFLGTCLINSDKKILIVSSLGTVDHVDAFLNAYLPRFAIPIGSSKDATLQKVDGVKTCKDILMTEAHAGMVFQAQRTICGLLFDVLPKINFEVKTIVLSGHSAGGSANIIIALLIRLCINEKNALDILKSYFSIPAKLEQRLLKACKLLYRHKPTITVMPYASPNPLFDTTSEDLLHSVGITHKSFADPKKDFVPYTMELAGCKKPSSYACRFKSNVELLLHILRTFSDPLLCREFLNAHSPQGIIRALLECKNEHSR